MSTMVDDQAAVGPDAVDVDGDVEVVPASTGRQRRRRRQTAVPVELLDRLGVGEPTVLRWRRLGWLGGPELWADDPAVGWADSEVVAQIGWLAQIHAMKSARRVDAADVAAGPVLRATGCRYGYRAAGADRWAPIGDVERSVAAALEQCQVLLIARVLPDTGTATGTATAGLGAAR